MFDVRLTHAFQSWLDGIRDLRAQIAIARRIERVAAGNMGDSKSLGDGISELRIDVGQGYRLYYVLRDRCVIVMLAGGNKSTQARDIRRAQRIAREI